MKLERQKLNVIKANTNNEYDIHHFSKVAYLNFIRTICNLKKRLAAVQTYLFFAFAEI